jgi:uncharacterized membrane protein (DUF106 family)
MQIIDNRLKALNKQITKAKSDRNFRHQLTRLLDTKNRLKRWNAELSKNL